MTIRRCDRMRMLGIILRKRYAAYNELKLVRGLPDLQERAVRDLDRIYRSMAHHSISCNRCEVDRVRRFGALIPSPGAIDV
jgi:hypothetical protein